MPNTVNLTWPPISLKSISSKIGSGATPRGGKNSYKESGISLIRSLNVYDFKFSSEGLAFIDEEQASNLNNVEVKRNDILLNITGASVARCCMVPNYVLPARVNQHVSIIRINTNLTDPHFVLNFLNSPKYKHHLLTLAQGGATREALTKETIENFIILLPPLPTQQKIASILSAYDDLIENNTRRIAILEEMAQMIYREWFVKFRFPGHENVPLTDSPCGSIPEGWEVSKLGDCIEFLYGKALKKKVRIPGLFPVYGSSGIVGYHERALVEEPGIIVGRKGNVGSIFRSNMPFYPIDTVYFVRSDLSQNFLFHALETMSFLNNDTAVPGLNRNQAYGLEVLLPTKDVLDSFEKLVEPIYVLSCNLIESNKKLSRIRDLLLPKLISGELDVSDLDIEIPESDEPELQVSAGGIK